MSTTVWGDTAAHRARLAVIAAANSKRMKKGIENALILDSVDVTPYYSSKVKEGDYGDDNTIVEFQKMDFCEYICSLDSDPLKAIFANLKKIIDMLATLFQNT